MNSNWTTLPASIGRHRRPGQQSAGAEPFTAYHAAHGRFNADPEARELIQQLSQSQAELRQKAGASDRNAERCRSIEGASERGAGRSRHCRLCWYPQQAAIGLLREINQEISELIGVDFAALAKRSGCC